MIYDAHGLTFKVGSGKADERLEALNLYRRIAQGEAKWSVHQRMEFDTVDAARAAEDTLVARVRALGFSSLDHGEFIIDITMKQLGELFAEAVSVGLDCDAAAQPRL